MAENAQNRNVERRTYRRVSDAIALQIEVIDGEAANDADIREIELPDHPTHVVNLSPGGLKCFHHEAFSDGDVVSLNIKFFPAGITISTRGRVVNSGEDRQKGAKDCFFAGIAFKGLTEEQQQLVLDHIDGVAKKSFGGSVKLIYKR